MSQIRQDLNRLRKKKNLSLRKLSGTSLDCTVVATLVSTLLFSASL